MAVQPALQNAFELRDVTHLAAGGLRPPAVERRWRQFDIIRKTAASHEPADRIAAKAGVPVKPQKRLVNPLETVVS
jgi:hypothetical protein